jgi:hypothetical protein
VIVAWNQAAHDIAFAEDQFLTFKGQRALAIMHLAMHDALNSIVPLYSRYAYTGRSNAAHPVTAVAQAAHDVLVSLHPGQQARLASELAAWVGPGGPPRDRGIELGRATAEATLARRASDGWDFQGTYEFRSGAGEYETTPQLQRNSASSTARARFLSQPWRVPRARRQVMKPNQVHLVATAVSCDSQQVIHALEP